MFNQKELEQIWNNFKQSPFDFTSLKPTVFNGYENVETKSTIVSLFNLQGEKISKLKGIGFMICNQTCFYAKGGGQVSDTGSFTYDNKIGEILDLRKTIVKGYYIHLVNTNDIELKINDVIDLKINNQRRIKISRNHSAIHIFYNMIEKVIDQKLTEIFSYLDDQKFYFETQLSDKVDLKTLQLAINESNKIAKLDLIPKIYYLTQQETEKLGLTTSTYKEFATDEKMRIVEYQNVSTELCGGTHAQSTGEFEQFFLLDFERLTDKLRISATVTFENYLLYIKNKTLPLINDYEIICKKIPSHPLLNQYQFDFNNIKSLEQLEQIKQQFSFFKEEAKQVEKQLHKQALDNLVINKEIINNTINSEIWTINDHLINNKDLTKLVMDEIQSSPLKMITIYNQATLNFIWIIGKTLQNQYNLRTILENDFKNTPINAGGTHFMLQGKLNNNNEFQILKDYILKIWSFIFIFLKIMTFYRKIVDYLR